MSQEKIADVIKDLLDNVDPSLMPEGKSSYSVIC